eukprot:gene7194-8000_t
MENILVVGDGNFSFSVALSKILSYNCCKAQCGIGIRPYIDVDGLAYKIYSTSYDEESVIKQNDVSWENVMYLKKLDHFSVHHGIDGTMIDKYFDVKFKKIIFNFPHVGGKSNVNACRALLAKFFESAASCIEDNGSIYVSLCKGQGGTPIDSGRKAYGNSWQIATQACKAGLVLADVKPFSVYNPMEYITAGYRGQLRKGFLKEGSLMHVFIKKSTIELPLSNNKCDAVAFMKTVEEFFKRQLTLINPYENSNNPLSEMTNVIKELSDQMLSLNVTKTVNSKHDYTREHKCTKELLSHPESCIKNGKEDDSPVSQEQDSIKLFSNHSWNPKESLINNIINTKNPLCFTETFINPTIDISPNSYPIYKEFVVTIPEKHFESLNAFAQHVMRFIEAISTHLSCHQRKCSDVNSSEAYHLNSQSGMNAVYDPSSVANFLHDINMNAWLHLQPEITITKEENMDFTVKSQDDSKREPALKYCNVQYKDYNLSEREARYFSNDKHQLSYSCAFEKIDAVDILIHDLVVARLGVVKVKAQDNNGKEIVQDATAQRREYVVVFHVDQMCMKLLQVEDIRHFWSTDYSYMKKLKHQLENRRLDQEMEHKPIVSYPLCYRHDLCFWVTDSVSEELLFAAIRFYTNVTIHSVRLLKILRHEETNLLSYCYRLIYSRCDGPLSHKETVMMQNALRLALMDMKFDLR